jgi:hypothetical protein
VTLLGRGFKHTEKENLVKVCEGKVLKNDAFKKIDFTKRYDPLRVYCLLSSPSGAAKEYKVVERSGAIFVIMF